MIGGGLLTIGAALLVGRLLYKAPVEQPPTAIPEPEEEPDGEPEVQEIHGLDETALDRNLLIAGAGGAAAITGSLIFPPANLLALGCIGYNAVPLVSAAWHSLREERRFSIEVLDLCSMSIAVGAHLYALASLASVIYFASCKLLMSGRRRTQDALSEALVEHPGMAWRQLGDVEIQVPVSDLAMGDLIVVYAGEVIPADGTVISGGGGVDQRALTGEAMPEDKGIRDAVFATTLLISGRLEVEVREAGSATVARQVEKALQRTQRFESRLVERGVRQADATVAPCLGIAGVALLGLGIPAALAVISANYMDVARVASPLSMLTHLGRAEGVGLLIRDGRSLEQVPGIDTFVFDKTGTLTQDQFAVGEVRLVGQRAMAEILTFAACAELRQPHPIARAIVDLAREHGLDLPEAEMVRTVVGNGLEARVGGEDLLIGSIRFLRGAGVAFEPPSTDNEQRSLVGLAIDGCLEAWFVLEPLLRPEVPMLMAELKRRGARIYILSGDHAGPTGQLAETLGVDGFFPEVLPQKKAEIIQEFQAEGRKVCFVGDGINDAIALKCANLSISIRGASDLALDSAQVVLLSQNLTGILALIDMGERFERDQKRAFWSVAAPSLFATGGVFLLGLGLNAVFALYSASAVSGAIAGLLPLLEGAREPEDSLINDE